jgi:hypothetical protein
MTARFLLSLAIALGLAGCSGDTGTTTKDTTPGDDDDVVGDDDDNQPTGETGDVAPPGFDVRYMLVQGDLGFDSATNSLVEVQVGGGAIPSAIYFLFGTETWRGSGFDLGLDAEYCAIILPLTSSAFAPWASADPTVWYGVDYTEGVAGAVTDCNTAGKEMDPAILGADPVSALVNDYGGWGAGIGEWGANWYKYYDPTTTPDFFATYVGGRIYSAAGWVGADDFLAFPVALDPTTFEAQDDGTYFIGVPSDQVYLGTTIATAWYRIYGLWLYSF